MNFYHTDALRKHQSIITGESTPSYLLHGDLVIPRIKSILPYSNVKFLVMLRNPVARAFSQYQMAIDNTGTPEQMATRGMSSYSNQSFEEIIEKEIKQLEDAGINVTHFFFFITIIPIIIIIIIFLVFLFIFNFIFSLIHLMKFFNKQFYQLYQ